MLGYNQEKVLGKKKITCINFNCKSNLYVFNGKNMKK